MTSGSEVLLRPKLDCDRSSIEWLHIWDENDWLAWRLQWRSLVMSVVMSKNKAAGTPRIQAVTMGKHEPLLKVCARLCFGSLPHVVLSNIASRIKVPSPPGISTFDLLKALLKHILNIDGGELADILAMRVKSQTCLDEYLDDPEVDELIDDTDRKDLQ